MTARVAVARPGRVSAAFAAATEVADVMLFEGYVLYPYRASARKNQQRWQFGVLMPPAFGQDSGEHAGSRTEVLVEPRPGATLHVRVRFLQAQRRSVEVAVDGGFAPTDKVRLSDRDVVAFDEGLVVERDVDLPLDAALAAAYDVELLVEGGSEVEELVEGGALAGRIVRTREPLRARLTLAAEQLAGPYGVVRVRLDLANVASWTPTAGARREDALRHALVAAHLLVGIGEGHVLSLLDPPEWATGFAAGCANEHTWPVLLGTADRDDVVLSSPIILYDHPQVAPESPGELYDATEIDEILSLRTMALTDDEKREARGTDPRAAAVVDRVDTMPPEILDRLHGTIRYLDGMTGAVPAPRPDTPWWDPGADPSVSPETDGVVVGGVRITRGSSVRLWPRLHGSDAQDVFLVGRTATVEAVLRDVDDETHLAVTVDDDPGADLQRAEGRFLYFRPEEVQPL